MFKSYFYFLSLLYELSIVKILQIIEKDSLVKEFKINMPCQK